MRKKISGAVILIFLLACFFSGCQNLITGDDPVARFIQLSPKGKATIAMKTFNMVFDDVESVLNNPIQTEAAKKIALEKLKVLAQYQQILSIYVGIVENGMVPTAADEEALIRFIQDLVAKGVKL